MTMSIEMWERIRGLEATIEKAEVQRDALVAALRHALRECEYALDFLPKHLIDPTCSLEAQASSEHERDEMAVVHGLKQAKAKITATLNDTETHAQ